MECAASFIYRKSRISSSITKKVILNFNDDYSYDSWTRFSNILYAGNHLGLDKNTQLNNTISWKLFCKFVCHALNKQQRLTDFRLSLAVWGSSLIRRIKDREVDLCGHCQTILVTSHLSCSNIKAQTITSDLVISQQDYGDVLSGALFSPFWFYYRAFGSRPASVPGTI